MGLDGLCLSLRGESCINDAYCLLNGGGWEDGCGGGGDEGATWRLDMDGWELEDRWLERGKCGLDVVDKDLEVVGKELGVAGWLIGGCVDITRWGCW